MEVEVRPVRVRPATVKKLQAEVTAHKQTVATDKLLAKLGQDAVVVKLQKEISSLAERVSILEQ